MEGLAVPVGHIDIALLLDQPHAGPAVDGLSEVSRVAVQGRSVNNQQVNGDTATALHDGRDQRSLVQEAALALRALRGDPVGLVPELLTIVSTSLAALWAYRAARRAYASERLGLAG